VQEYWIIDPENQSVLVFRLDGHILKEIAALTNEEELSSPLFTGLQMKVSAVFNL
jgi:Uma2 family endonuclease